MAAFVKDSSRISPARLAGSAILASQSDDRLVSLARSGHERAFEAIVDRYRRPLLRFCRGILPESRAEDAVQQTFINAHAALTDSDDAVQLKPWLFAIARNASLNMLRQNGWSHDEIPADFDGVRRPDQVIEQRAELEQTVSAMNDLPDRQRSALVMREFEGRSYAEIGLALGANDGAVRQLLNRARGALRSAATAFVPPPMIARLATSAPPDGRRVAEIAGGLGAAGVAKAGATALVAGTLVVGAINAPLPTGHSGKPTRQQATLMDTGPATKAAPIAASQAPTSAPIAHVHTRSRGAARHVASTTPAAVVKHTTRRSASPQSGSGQHSGSHHESASGDHSHSGSGDTGHSGSDDSPDRSGSGSSGSDDRVSSEPDAPVASTPDGGGSDSSGTSGGSDDPSTVSGSGTSGSSSSGSGSDGSSEPDAPAALTP